MSRTPLSYYSSYYVDTKVDPAAVTNYGGIFPYLDLMLLVDLPQLVSERLPQKGMRAWQHAEHVAALLALNLTGGDCVEDLVKLDGDPGISLYMGQIAQEDSRRGYGHAFVPDGNEALCVIVQFSGNCCHSERSAKRGGEESAFDYAAVKHL